MIIRVILAIALLQGTLLQAASHTGAFTRVSGAASDKPPRVPRLISAKKLQELQEQRRHEDKPVQKVPKLDRCSPLIEKLVVSPNAETIQNFRTISGAEQLEVWRVVLERSTPGHALDIKMALLRRPVSPILYKELVKEDMKSPQALVELVRSYGAMETVARELLYADPDVGGDALVRIAQENIFSPEDALMLYQIMVSKRSGLYPKISSYMTPEKRYESALLICGTCDTFFTGAGDVSSMVRSMALEYVFSYRTEKYAAQGPEISAEENEALDVLWKVCTHLLKNPQVLPKQRDSIINFWLDMPTSEVDDVLQWFEKSTVQYSSPQDRESLYQHMRSLLEEREGGVRTRLYQWLGPSVVQEPHSYLSEEGDKIQDGDLIHFIPIHPAGTPDIIIEPPSGEA